MVVSQVIVKCEACRNAIAVQSHHFIRKWKLSKVDKKKKKFQVMLCNTCHQMYHDDKEFSGEKFYDKFPHLVKILLERCNYDYRFVVFLMKRKEKKENYKR